MTKLPEEVLDRIKLIKEGEEPESLKTHLCPFFANGGHPDCILCKQTEEDLEECKDYYIERILAHPLVVWDDSFDSMAVSTRDKIPLAEVSGIGITCDSCYMYDKCTMYKSGYSCAIDWGANKPESTSEFFDFLINTQYERVNRASVFEKLDGGVPDVGLSGEIDRLNGLLLTKNDLGRERLSINVEASSPASGGGGILAAIFGGGSKTPAIEESKTIEIAEKSKSAEDIEYIEELNDPPVKEKVPRKTKKG